MFAEVGGSLGKAFAGCPVVDGEQADVGVIQLARDTDAELWVDDVAGVQQVDGRGEVVGVFEKEGPQLGEVHRVTLVHGELRLIGFHLAEVRVDGRVDDDGIVKDGLGFPAGGALEMTGAEVRVVGIQR